MSHVCSEAVSREYSVERLLRLLLVLGRDVEIIVRKPSSRRRGRLSIEAA